MTTHDEWTHTPDADRLAAKMLQLLGHEDHVRPAGSPQAARTPSRAPDVTTDPERAAAVRESSRRDRERYLNAGLTPVDCRFCHATVAVKKIGAGHTAVQWNSASMQRCATFAELRAAGGDSSRSRACPKLADSIRHAVAEGCLDEESTAPSPGDG